MNQVATLTDQTAQAPALLTTLERLVLNPDVDPSKIHHLLDAQERILAKQAASDFFQAMNKAQQEMGRVAANKTNNQTRSKYADYSALDKVLRPIYSAHGFSLSFNTEPTDQPDTVVVTCDVSHIGGHTKAYRIAMPSDGKGAKGNDVMTKTHATGAAASYGMRYLLKMIFNVAIGEDDTDGNPPAPQGITTQQVEQIRFALKDKGLDESRFCKDVARVDSVEDIQPGRFSAAMNWINKQVAK